MKAMNTKIFIEIKTINECERHLSGFYFCDLSPAPFFT